jgi:hypothetical protein
VHAFNVIKRAFEAGGIEFIEEDGGGSGVRLQERRLQKKVLLKN